jgi:hypothetical protein
MPTGSRQLLAFEFGSDSRFEGQLVGALERIESGGTVLLEHGSADALSDAVARVGGTQIAGGFVDASRMSELTPRLLAAAAEAG